MHLILGLERKEGNPLLRLTFLTTNVELIDARRLIKRASMLAKNGQEHEAQQTIGRA